MRTITMHEAEARQEQERAEAWLVLAEMLGRGEANFAPVEDERVPRMRRPRRSGRGPLAA
jgi:hypothetical protein